MNYKTILKLALLQLQEYSDNKLIIQDGEVIDIEETLQKIEDTQYISELQEAKNILEERGNYLGNLWSLADVQEKYDCTDEEAYKVLDQALQNDATMSQIWYAIDFHAEDNGLKQKEVEA